jgi:hypothetical protein
MREKEIAVWNVNDLSKPLELKRMDTSPGAIIPLYDEDTSMLFFFTRGESTIRWLEIAESSPYMTDGTPFAAPGPVSGAGLVPKRILNVMQTEIVRILTVNSNGLWPIHVSVPRKVSKSYRCQYAPPVFRCFRNVNKYSHCMLVRAILISTQTSIRRQSPPPQDWKPHSGYKVKTTQYREYHWTPECQERPHGRGVLSMHLSRQRHP